jgi:Matrixin
VLSNFRRSLLTALLISGVASAQTSLILKNRKVSTDPAQLVLEAQGSGASGGGHLLLQFNRSPTAGQVTELSSRGVNILADVPEDGLLVSVNGPVNLRGLGIRYASPIDATDKISALDAANTNGHLLVEFYPDVNANDARALLLNAGAVLSENPDLGPHNLMIQTSDMALVGNLAQMDAVSYIFPASDELAQGIAVNPCVGALTTNGATTQSIPTYGNGWDGPGLGSATVYYFYTNVSSQLNAASAKAEIARAMAQWSAVVKVTWAPGASATATQTVNILWATYAHGDAYPFDGPGGMLAHTFYPANPNPEPVAGDMHLDDSESWNIGKNIDLFSVTLHELGHALGLGHSDNPNDVMYPYYKMNTGLQAGDIAAIQTLYAAQTGSTPPPIPTPAPTPSGSPLALTVYATASTTTAATVSLSGVATGGSGAISVSWSTASSSVAVSGTAAMGSAGAWTISNIALAMGVNTITVTASTGSGTHVSQVVTVTRQAVSTTPPAGGGTDTTPPTLTIGSPGGTTVLTSATAIAFSGTSSDNVGVTKVTWSTNTGSSGTASGTTNWSASIPLLTGSNVVTIRAYDAAGNSGWRSVVVTRH